MTAAATQVRAERRQTKTARPAPRFLGALDNNHVIPDPSMIFAKGRNPFRDDLTDQPRSIFLGRHDAGPFVLFPFHGDHNGDQAVQRIAR